MMKALALLITMTVSIGGATAAERPTVIVVVGAEGTAEYGKQFRQWAGRWEAAAKRTEATYRVIGLESEDASEDEATDRERMKQQLAAEVKASAQPLWLVLIGHGTFDGKTAKFNLRGIDVSAAELAEWLKPIERPLAIVNCASSSGPFLTALSGPNRVVVTATKSGFEQNFSRFGDYLSAAIVNPQADLDKDEQTSLLEAFLLAAAGVQEFYSQDGRLVTEHALLDDNGDRMGTAADWFRGVRAIKVAKEGASPDGLRASQFHLVASGREQQLPSEARARRDELEWEIAALRERKTALKEDEYFGHLEPLLVELARLYQPAE